MCEREPISKSDRTCPGLLYLHIAPPKNQNKLYVFRLVKLDDVDPACGHKRLGGGAKKHPKYDVDSLALFTFNAFGLLDDANHDEHV